MRNPDFPTVAGIDVGGTSKGFHVVSLKGSQVRTARFSHPREVADWCRKEGAHAVAIDAPCRWSVSGRARNAEKELMKLKIWCFSTPTQEVAERHPKNHFAWMLAGHALYREMQQPWTAYTGEKTQGPVVFETFPHAISCALSGRVVSAKGKAKLRRVLLQGAQINTAALKNIDFVDAALCALIARMHLGEQTTMVGDAQSGFIVLPKCNLLHRPCRRPAPLNQ